jgi:hypothetical protein
VEGGHYIQRRSQHSETEPMGTSGENCLGAEETNCSHVCTYVCMYVCIFFVLIHIFTQHVPFLICKR